MQFKNEIIRQFLRYLVTGGLAFVVDFGFFALCLYVFNLHYLLANFFGLVAGLILNYCLSIKWVFNDCQRVLEKRKTAEFSVFAVVGFLGVGINQLCMLLMVGSFEWQEMLSKIIAAGIVLLWNFGSRKVLLFRNVKGC